MTDKWTQIMRETEPELPEVEPELWAAVPITEIVGHLVPTGFCILVMIEAEEGNDDETALVMSYYSAERGVWVDDIDEATWYRSEDVP